MQEQVLEQDEGEMMKVGKVGKETMEMRFDEEAEKERKEWANRQLASDLHTTDGRPFDGYGDYMMDATRYLLTSPPTGTRTETESDGPGYYRDTRYEPRLVAKDWGLDPYLFNVMKYIKRCGLKVEPGLSQIESEIKDLRKAIAYIEFRIEELEEMKDEEYDYDD